MRAGGISEKVTLPRSDTGTSTAFVLAGGGSLGAVQVGMLRALVEAGVAAHLVVGTSAGAINGAFFAARPDREGVDELAAVWGRIRRKDVFPIAPFRGLRALLGRSASLVPPGGLRKLLEEHLPRRRLEEATLRLGVVATDLGSGREVVLCRGPAVRAVLASAAIPSVFPPVEWEGRLLVDGAVASNTPIRTAAELGARRIIVLPTGFTCRPRRLPRGGLGVALHALNLILARQLLADVQLLGRGHEIRIVPPVCPLAPLPHDFSATGSLIEGGARTARRWLREGGLDRAAVPPQLGPHHH